MSSLAAARADNFYFPPDWTPEAGSLNKFAGCPPGHLGKRAKKLDQGILVIRFEMPFNVWCTGCRHLIAKGVRFNAEKRCVGKYHTTKIWAFNMRTPCCSTELEIHTDPKACEYVIVRGAEQKTEAYSSADAETVSLAGHAEREEVRSDAFRALESANGDAAAARAAAPTVAALHARSQLTSRDDYTANKALRRAMRVQRAEAAVSEAHREALGLPEHIPLLLPTAEDAVRAAAVAFNPPPSGSSRFDERRREKRLALRSCAVLGASPAPATSSPAQQSLMAKRKRMEAAGVTFGRPAGADVFGGGLARSVAAQPRRHQATATRR